MGAKNRSRVVPGLDGLRGVAVLAVMAFHAGLAGVGGGLLGVDVFFVLSGFLVTSLLVQEHASTGDVNLRRFWCRRARRLLPALLLLLGGISLYARWGGSGLSPIQVRGDALSTLLYVANWHYILTGQNYFVRFGASSPLLHTWSLGVEEQFYLIWPILALLVLRRYGRRGLGWTAGVLGGTSAATCAALFLAGSPVDRVYYGTDTRAQSLMVGALLAVLPLESFRSVWLWGVAGALALLFALHSVQGNGPFLYEGGFLFVAVAAALVVALTVSRPDHPLSRALSGRALRYTGRISYGLYLYHWPLFLLLNQARTGIGGTPLLLIRFAATFAVAAASFHFIENPVRSGRGWPMVPVRLAGAVAGIGVVLGLVTVSAAPSVALPASPVATTGGPQVRALLLGDSMALTLGKGLSVNSAAWGVSIDNEGKVGCDLDPASTVNVMGTVSRAAQGCPDWRTDWASLITKDDPSVVVVLLGRWETIDRMYLGRWTTTGQPAFDSHLQGELAQVARIGSSRGAHVVFLTLPYIAQTTDQPDGAPWDMNLPGRTNAFNADVHAVAARYPSSTSVIDLNAMLDPGGHYVSYIGKVRVRDYDHEHISLSGGEWLRGLILPKLDALGGASSFSNAA